MHMVHLCSRCSQTIHAMDMEIMPLDRAKINVANVVPVLCLELWMPQMNNFSRFDVYTLMSSSKIFAAR